jgi:hypothetical protein
MLVASDPLLQIVATRGCELAQRYLLTLEFETVARVGSGVGSLVGGNVGGFVGAFVGGNVGGFVGAFVGGLVGSFVGRFVGALVGSFVGRFVGALVGSFVGTFVGALVGSFVGTFVGALVGFVGTFVGAGVGGAVTIGFTVIAKSSTSSYPLPDTHFAALATPEAPYIKFTRTAWIAPWGNVYVAVTTWLPPPGHV